MICSRVYWGEFDYLKQFLLKFHRKSNSTIIIKMPHYNRDPLLGPIGVLIIGAPLSCNKVKPLNKAHLGTLEVSFIQSVLSDVLIY